MDLFRQLKLFGTYVYLQNRSSIPACNCLYEQKLVLPAANYGKHAYDIWYPTSWKP